MSEPSVDLLEANLAYLPPPTQQALRAAAQPAISLQRSARCLAASIHTDDGRWVAVHASEDPIAASIRVAEKLLKGEPPLIVVIGLGLGYLLDAIEATRAAVKVLAVEPLPAITRAMFMRRDWSEWLSTGRLTIVAGPDYTGAGDIWGLFGRSAATPPTIMSPLIEREFPEEGARAKHFVKQIVAGARANEDARRRFAGRYLLNTLANIPAIAAEGDAASLFGAFARVPAVVVGAGPSLDRNLRDIARLDGRVLIVAVDTAVRPLLAAGIHPHLVVSVDPSALNARHLQALPETRGTWLVAEGSLDPSIFPQFAGRTFTFKVSQHHPWPWLESLGVGRGTLRAWGSVLTTAFDLACRAGCDPIVFAGADLAYSGGLQYCRNTVYEPQWQHLRSDAERAGQFTQYLAQHPHLGQPDVRGHEVVTTPHFIQFRDWIVARATEAADRRIVNATGAGILHGGRITQAELPALHLPRAAHDLAVHQRLHAAWTAGSDMRRSGHTLLAQSLADAGARPMDAWLDFGGDTAPRDQITQAAEWAGAGVAGHARRSVYLAQRATEADAHSTTLEQAKQWIHPNYDAAARQAEGQQAHVLLELMQRSHRTPDVIALGAMVSTAAQQPEGIRVLDVGCGVGRTMEPFAAAGIHVDGVDISRNMIEFARRSSTLARAQFFLSNGDDCGAAPDGSYDIATLHLMLHFVTSRAVRLALLRAIARALRPGGMVFVQMPYDPERAAADIQAPDVSWLADDVEATRTGAAGQVWPTADALPAILQDFGDAFQDIRLQFVNFPVRPDRPGKAPTHLLVSGSTTRTLASRIYALRAVASAATAERQPAVIPFPGSATRK